MKRTLIVLVVGLLSVGCATVKDIGVHLGIGQPSSTKAEQAKELTPEQKKKALRDSLVGEYETDDQGYTLKWVFLANGFVERHVNGKYHTQYRWTIVNGEILHIEAAKTVTWVFRINKDRSISFIAEIEDGKRKDGGYTAKKIK